MIGGDNGWQWLLGETTNYRTGWNSACTRIRYLQYYICTHFMCKESNSKLLAVQEIGQSVEISNWDNPTIFGFNVHVSRVEITSFTSAYWRKYFNGKNFLIYSTSLRTYWRKRQDWQWFVMLGHVSMSCAMNVTLNILAASSKHRSLGVLLGMSLAPWKSSTFTFSVVDFEATLKYKFAVLRYYVATVAKICWGRNWPGLPLWIKLWRLTPPTLMS